MYQLTAEFKYKVAVEATYGQKTHAEICSQFGVALTQAKDWKRELSDQGVQYTSAVWLKKLEENKILISMDGRRRFADNIFIERFWPSIKYEDIYLNHYASMASAQAVVAQDEEGGQVPIAFVAVRDGSKVLPAELTTFCRENLAAYRCRVSLPVCPICL